METIEWSINELLPFFRIFLYFLFPDLTLFWFLTVLPSSVQGEPKIQAMPGSALLRLSYSNNNTQVKIVSKTTDENLDSTFSTCQLFEQISAGTQIQWSDICRSVKLELIQISNIF